MNNCKSNIVSQKLSSNGIISGRNVDILYLKVSITNIIAKKVSNPKCFIFSDDPEWVRSNIEFEVDSLIVDVNRADQPCFEMKLMSSCKHFVLSNSSFSWWAAWLATYKEKTVIAPKKWFVSEKINTDDLIPQSWERR